MIIGTVVEGPTVRLVIENVLRHILDDHELRFLPVQPLPTLGEFGTGWKGVRYWCRQMAKDNDLDIFLSDEAGTNLDLLVVHVDADIVTEHDLQEGLGEVNLDIPVPCPPADGNAHAIQQLFHRWLLKENLPSKIVFAIPSQDMENWTFAALFPSDTLCERPDYECIQSGRNRNNHPGHCLTLQQYAWPGCGKILTRHNGEIKKSEKRYRRIVGKIVENWETVCGICTQAAAFEQSVLERTR